MWAPAELPNQNKLSISSQVWSGIQHSENISGTLGMYRKGSNLFPPLTLTRSQMFGAQSAARSHIPGAR